MKGQEEIKLSDHAGSAGKSFKTLLNAAKRQTIPAFREKEHWMIGGR
jgi:hypothetical protein